MLAFQGPWEVVSKIAMSVRTEGFDERLGQSIICETWALPRPPEAELLQMPVAVGGVAQPPGIQGTESPWKRTPNPTGHYT